jgi:hypothetical protein
VTCGGKFKLWAVLYIGVLDRIIEDKDSNLFLVHNRLYLMKIWKKIEEGRIRSVCTGTGFGLGLAGLRPNP